jgi:hypothetical protein
MIEKQHQQHHEQRDHGGNEKANLRVDVRAEDEAELLDLLPLPLRRGIAGWHVRARRKDLYILMISTDLFIYLFLYQV